MNLQDQVDACVRYLREHGKAIGAAARDGHPLCTRIVDFYHLVRAKAEPHAVALLEDAIAEHRKMQAKEDA